MIAVLNGGWRSVRLIVALGAAVVIGVTGCAKRPSQDTAPERPPGFYLLDTSALESDDAIVFPIDLVGGTTEKVFVRFTVADWGATNECQQPTLVAPDRSGKLESGTLMTSVGINCAVIQGSIPGYPYYGNIKGNQVATSSNQVPVPGDFFSTVVAFEPGDVRKYVEVPLVHLNGKNTNGYYERTKRVLAQLADSTLINGRQAQGLITNLDEAPKISFQWSDQGQCASSVSCNVVEQEQPSKVLSVLVNGLSDLPIKVPLILGGTAVNSIDYIVFNGGREGKDLSLANKLASDELLVLSFGTSTSAVVEVIDDADEETEETLTVGVSRKTLLEKNSQVVKKGDKSSVTMHDIQLVGQNEVASVNINIAANDPHSYAWRPISPMFVRSCIQIRTQSGKSELDQGHESSCPSPDITNNGNADPVTFSSANFPGQDASKSEGNPSYTLYDNNGNVLWPRDPNSGSATIPDFKTNNGQVSTVDLGNGTSTDVACIKDNHTGLLWEAKNFHVASGYKDPSKDVYSLHAFDKEFATYSYLSDYKNSRCTIYGESSVSNPLNPCNVDYFVAEVNHERLCGKTGWRLPSIEELRSLVRYDPEPRWDNPLSATRKAQDNSSIFFHDANFFWWLSDSAGIQTSTFGGNYLSGDTTSRSDSSSVVGLGIVFKNEATSPFPNLVGMSHGQAILVHD